MSESFPSSRPTVLMVDDDRDVLITAELLLARRGYQAVSASTPDEARAHLGVLAIDVVLLDLNFSPRATSGEEGLRLLAEILRHDPSAAVIVLTGHSGVNIAVAAMRAGATDFLMKPWSNSRLLAAVEGAVEKRREVGYRPPRLRPDNTARASRQALIVGDSPAMARARNVIARAAMARAPVLIHGEAGTGKSLFADTIRRQSNKTDAPFVVLDFSAAFQSADHETAFIQRDMPVAFAAARGGDLVLEEVGALPLPLAAALSTHLATAQSAKEGPVRTIATTVRTRRSLEEPGGLPADLLHQLSVLEIFAPPLRDRREDLPLLINHFLHLYAVRYDRPVRQLTPGAMSLLEAGVWPGNVRALERVIERGVILSDGPRIELDGLGDQGGEFAAHQPEVGGAAFSLARSERTLIEAALKRHSFNVSRAAKDLDLTRTALYRRMAKHGL